MAEKSESDDLDKKPDNEDSPRASPRDKKSKLTSGDTQPIPAQLLSPRDFLVSGSLKVANEQTIWFLYYIATEK